MSDLVWKKLSEVVELVIDNRGKNPKSYATEGIPVIDNYLITSDGEANLGEVNRYIDEETYNSFLRKYIVEGDVLMTLVGNGYGKVATTPRERCAIIQNTIGLRCNKDNSNQFLYYLLRSNRESLMNLNRGAAQPSIKVGDVLNLEFGFPSIDKQNRIASVLGAIDKKIQLNRQTNQTLEQIAQAIFKSWFVDFDPVRAKIAAREAFIQQHPEVTEEAIRAAAGTEGDTLAHAGAKACELAAISGKSEEQLNELDAETLKQLKATAALFPDAFVDSELGEMPKGWFIQEMKDLAEMITKGTTPRKPDVLNAEDQAVVPFVKVKDITDDGEIVRSGLELIPASIHENALKRSILKTNDILFSIAGTIGRVSVVEFKGCSGGSGKRKLSEYT
ncbi:MAG: restriction endonuclease subunit S [Candidatus Thiodiazotropha sp.]